MAVIPDAIEGQLSRYLRALERVAGGQVAAVYLVGGAALGDFSPRQSNVDLVVVSQPALEPAQLADLRRAEQKMERAGRAASVWHADWDLIADGPIDRSDGHPLETPLTRALLREEAVAVAGPDWPVVAFEGDGYRAWCRSRLEALAADEHGLMVMRRGVSELVLEAARLAEGAASGRVLSKSEAGRLALELVPLHFRRILNDSVGFRNGANASMYWGPFERKYDARRLIVHLAEAVRA